MSRGLQRRHLGLLAMPALARPGSGAAASYPDRPVRVIVPYAPGGGGDAYTRVVIEPMSEYLGQPLVVENRAGGATITGSNAVAKGPADGYTILFAGSTLFQAPSLLRNPPFDPVADFVSIGRICLVQYVFVVSDRIQGVTDMPDFIAAAKGRRFAFGSFGNGSTVHVFAQLFSNLAGLDMTHVAYRGETLAMSDLLGGQIQCGLFTIATAQPLIREGRIRAIGLLGRERAENLPEVPIFAELGYPQVYWEAFSQFSAPARTPPEAVKRLSDALGIAIARPEVIARLKGLGVVPDFQDSQTQTAAFRDAATRWTALIRELGIQPE